MNANRLLAAAIALVLCITLGLGSAMAQRSKKDKEPPPYPDATREEPSTRVTGRLQHSVEKLYKAYEDEKNEEVLKLGKEIVANDKSEGYARAFAYRLMADAADQADDVAHAMEYMKAALDENALSNEQHFQTMLALSQLLMSEERDAEALQILERFFSESHSTKPEYLVIKANALYRLERYPEAVAMLESLIAEAKEVPASWRALLMSSYVEMEQPAKAAVVGERILAEKPDDKTALMNLASLYLESEQEQKAFDLLQGARARGTIATEEDYQRVYRIYYNLEGHENDAIEVMTEGLDKGILKPSHEVYNLLGQTYYFSDRVPQAIEAWVKAVELATNGKTALNLARVYYNEAADDKALYPKAKAMAQKALQQGLERPSDAYVLLGNVELYGLGNKGAAIAAFQEAVKDPQNRQQAEQGLKQARR